MKKYVVKIPFFVPFFFPKRRWHFSRTEKTIYLTFDDGPIPEVTPWALNELKKHNAKATFFCIGKNIEENPGIFRQITQEGHTVGNHTYNHLNGWQTETSVYIENVEKSERQVTEDGEKVKNKELLFRPPYGKITGKQAKFLWKKGYQIVMWDVLSGDFDKTLSKEKCLENVLKNSGNGSIVIFHDSEKASKNLQYVLPKVLAHFSEKGFRFKAIA
ncbi:MAG: polysaccharide deacetylase family protein [Flavobacteriaceae bacterium]